MRLSHPVYMALANLDDILDVTVPPARYEQLPQFPATVRDIAMLVRRSVTHRDVLRAVAEAREPLLEKVELFDIFEDVSTLGADRRSMAYSFTYRDPERTLTDKQVNKVHDGMRAMLAERLGAELR
jgi:phenylalanyl-tRNA synthetase beta chain